MKLKIFFPVLLCAPLFLACSEFDTIKGNQSPMGEVGVTVSSTTGTVAGVGSINGEVIALEDGVSEYSGTATVSNENIKNILTNFPGTDIEGNTVSISNLKFKNTEKGIEAVTGLAKGVIVDYDAKVGDEYKTSDGVRTVISRSTDDDYMYGFFLIKVIEVEENPNKYGVKQIRYWANHRFGLVGIEFTFDDNSTARFPVYCSTQN